jgi:hypothetical protein
LRNGPRRSRVVTDHNKSKNSVEEQQNKDWELFRDHDVEAMDGSAFGKSDYACEIGHAEGGKNNFILFASKA